MTSGLPGSGQISIGQVSVEILKSATATTSLDEANVRTLFGIPSGQIDLNTGHGKQWVVPNSQAFYSSGSFSVPRYAYLTVQLWGGGGGGGGGGGNDSWAYGYNGGAGGGGGTTSFNSSTTMNAYGGGAGGPCYDGGAGGQDGPSGSYGSTGGGAAGGGSLGGNNGQCWGGAGGNGGYISKTWYYTDAGAPAWFSSMYVTIGGGGGGGGSGENNRAGYPGNGGQAVISWT